MVIAIIAILIAGAGNFAMHRWMLESGHPLVEVATGPMRRTLGRHSTYVLEFALLMGALWLAEHRWFPALMLYGVYTVLNAATIGWLKGHDWRD
jgi:hypothetical protein